MTTLGAVIVDDEPIARQALCRMLTEFPELEILGEADGIDQADSLIRETKADIVFLDVELFGENGFDLVPRLDKQVAIVFVTAFNQYAIRAFEVNALDYLLKPVTRERLAESIQRLLGRDASAPPPQPDREHLRIDDQILVRDGKIRRWLPLKSVCLIEASGDFTTLHSIDGPGGTTWRRVSEWERLLPKKQFALIRRGSIVNLDHVTFFETAQGNRLQLQLKGLFRSCNASRRLTALLRQRLRDRFSSPQP